ncbi:lactoylglutathione lyase [Rhodoferax koreense]|uniref:Aldoketomutase n=1 Tax=Rhodoferax koreensis TaxID=1842727 RepID=A0A1P8JRJ2_9BURK|nr:VOC family protein [Rhodoferax koreense]APW36360.1 lactoylglutathione lyase [Rhodoferax koreense]
MSKIIHTMIRVADLDRSIRFYADLLDLSESHRLDFPDFALVYLRSGECEFELELTLNKGREEPYTHGSGYGHIAAVVDDANAERARLLGMGYQPGDVKEFRRGEELLARFFFIQDPDGYKIEVLERHGHYH